MGVRGPQQRPSRSPGWALTPRCLAVCAFPYLLAFTTDSMEIRLVVNGTLVHTAVVPQLQLVASRVSRAGVYFCLRGFGCPSTTRSQAGEDTFVARLMLTPPHVCGDEKAGNSPRLSFPVWVQNTLGCKTHLLSTQSHPCWWRQGSSAQLETEVLHVTLGRWSQKDSPRLEQLRA